MACDSSVEQRLHALAPSLGQIVLALAASTRRRHTLGSAAANDLPAAHAGLARLPLLCTAQRPGRKAAHIAGVSENCNELKPVDGSTLVSQLLLVILGHGGLQRRGRCL